MGWFDENPPVPRTNMPTGTPQQFTGPTTAQPAPTGGAQDPQAFFNSLFPGNTLTPQQLAAQEAQLQAQGIRLLGPNAAGMRTKIELPNGQIIDVIGGAGAGHNRRQWMNDGPAGPTSGAGGTLGGMMGSTSGSMAGGADYGARLPALEKTPGYQFRMEQGIKGLEDHAASKGTLLTGGAAKDAIQFGQGLASTEFNNKYRRLFGMAGLGQGAQGQIGQYASGYADNATNLLTGQGDARASGTIGGANATNNFLGQAGQTAMDAYMYQQYLGRPQTPQTTAAGYPTPTYAGATLPNDPWSQQLYRS